MRRARADDIRVSIARRLPHGDGSVTIRWGGGGYERLERVTSHHTFLQLIIVCVRHLCDVRDKWLESKAQYSAATKRVRLSQLTPTPWTACLNN